MLAAVLAATALVVRRRLAHLDRLERGLASVVVGTGVLIAVHLVPLMLGILTRGSVLAAAALAVGLAALVKPAFAFAPPEQNAPSPGSGPASWVLAGLAAAFAAIAALADLGRWAGDELVGVDPLTFHLPNVGRWIQLHSMWQIDQFVPLLAHGNYPNNGDVVLLSTVLPWHNDFLVRLPITFYLVTTAIAVFAVARELRAPRATSVLAAAVVVSLPVVGIATIPRALPDSLMWTTFACGVLFLLRHARTSRRSDLVLAGVALGVAAGTKWYGVSSVAVVVVIWAGARLRARAGRRPRRGAARQRARRRPLVPRHAALAGAQPRALRQPRLPAEGRSVRADDLRRAARRHPRRGRLRDRRLRRRQRRPLADRGRDRRGAGDRADRVRPGAGGRDRAGAPARPRADGRVLALAVGAIALGLLYTITPATALGVKGDPSLAHANTRYAVPALILAVPVAAWLAGRLPRLAGARAGGRARGRRPARRLPRLRGARPARRRAGHGRPRAARRRRRWCSTACASGGPSSWPRRWRPRSSASPPPTGSRTASTAGATSASTAPSTGCCGSPPPTSGSPSPATGRWPACPPSGPRSGRASTTTCEFVGEFKRGFLTPYPTAARFQDALRRGRYDVLVVGRGFFPPQSTREQAGRCRPAGARSR